VETASHAEQDATSSLVKNDALNLHGIITMEAFNAAMACG
jgi:hypothetical protein